MTEVFQTFGWFYPVDPGVARAAKHQLGVPSAEERGALLEGLL